MPSGLAKGRVKHGLQYSVPAKMMPLLQPKRYKALWGGRGSAKSHTFAELMIARCVERTTRCACVREVQSSIKESVKHLLELKIKELGVEDEFDILQTEIRHKINGSLIIFRGLRDVASTQAGFKSLEAIDICWVEEAHSLSEKSWQTLRPTIRNEASEIWCSWNQRFPNDAVDKFFRSAPRSDAIVIEVNWRDNPAFPDVLYDEMTSDYQSDFAQADHVWGSAYQTVSKGAFYARLLYTARQAGRITTVPHDPALLTWTAWDLGIADPTSIWWCQPGTGPSDIRVIDWYEASDETLDHFAGVVRSKPYTYDTHILPHDAKARNMETGRSRSDVLGELLPGSIKVLGADDVMGGISHAQMTIPKMWFDETKCDLGLDFLRAYRAKEDGSGKPLHDDFSHTADAFRYLCIGIEQRTAKVTPRQGAIVEGGWMS